MNTFGRLACTAMPGLSTDQIALSVNRFIVQRSALMSRPKAYEERRPAGAPVPPELLYPSQYAERNSPNPALRRLLSRKFVITLRNPREARDAHASRFI
jgi:hypothetical protein